MFFGFGKKKQTPTKPVETGLGEEHAVLDFDVTLGKLQELSPKAQATFLYRLVGVLPFKVVKTLNGYTAKRMENDKTANIGQRQPYID
jgi:hypothetical protein